MAQVRCALRADPPGSVWLVLADRKPASIRDYSLGRNDPCAKLLFV